jgi:hypothetical protein
MKHTITACFWFFLSASICIHAQQVTTTNPDKTKVKETGMTNTGNTNLSNLAMQGAYSMLMQIMNDGNRDSILNVQQFKIYTDRHFMYAHPLPGDSLAYFGIGTYRIDNGQLIEYPFYTSATGAENDTIDIQITKLTNGYVQVINFPPDSQGKQYVLTEEYGNVSAPLTSPLDGAWKLTKSVFVPKTGATRTDSVSTQYKVFQSGHFMWARTSTDSATRQPVSTFGYGTFEMGGGNKARERTTNSTFRTTLIGKPLNVQLKLMGNNAYQQTIDWPDGKSIEVYQRLQ